MNDYLIAALKLAGLAQLVLVAGSVAIPKCLNWKGGLSGLMPLLRKMFWTYAVYISVMHVFFGVVSLFAAEELVSGGFITTALCVLMLIWWFARILIQFFYFDKTGILRRSLINSQKWLWYYYLGFYQPFMAGQCGNTYHDDLGDISDPDNRSNSSRRHP